MSLSDIKFADLPIVRLKYCGGHPATQNCEWEIGNLRILTANDPSKMEFFDEIKSAKMSIPVKAIWGITNVPSKNLNTQISVLIHDQGARIFDMHLLFDANTVDQANWDEIIDLMEKSFKQALQKRTIH
jgi:hypothetical protein